MFWLNSAAVNTGVHVSFQIRVFSRYMPRSGIVGLYGNSIFFLINLFIYFWLHWVFIAVRGLSLAVASRDYSSLQCAGFSLRWLFLLRSMGRRCAGSCSCGAWA